jgi:aldo/keto reductase family protein
MGIRETLVNGPLGFGAATLGNMFRELTAEEAAETVDAVWQHGTRFPDTAPQCGAGLSDIRFGIQLAAKADRKSRRTTRRTSRSGSTCSDCNAPSPRVALREGKP